ncbi:ATP/GTP-binding protein [Streptomyces sp. NRRL S-813]|uniref:ATP/GTP-binding protein n=1 Tax=Streptomyces sp. NRRL S-813 TaxID=1463919 RepID=UPI00131D0C7B|nr:ATP/GTP-binding protein [Streptomyces sp. NRRL S-813]
MCASDAKGTPGSSGIPDNSKQGAGTSSSSNSSPDDCTYTKLVPQPPPENLTMQDAKRRGGKGAAYQVICPSTGRFGVVWIPDGQNQPAAPQIDPEVLARRAVDSMKLVGPKVANPKAGGKYVVGMPTWMWVDQTLTTYGPNSATATAGGVTVTATAEVSSISWDMGDGTPSVVCDGPGTKYTPSMGKTQSPDCGHVYDKASTDETGGKFHGTAKATWTVNWQVTGGPADAGSFTEVRQTQFTVDVREVQVLN